VRNSILIVDDDKPICKALTILLTESGYDVEAVHHPDDAVERLGRHTYNLMILDIRLPKISGLELLKIVKERFAPLHVIVVTSYASVDSAIEAMKLGAYDYLTKPFSNDDIRLTVRRVFELQRISNENVRLKKELDERFRADGLVAMSEQMQEVCRLIEKISYTRSNVLIIGESGTGKSLVARVIHSNSPRAERRFVSINCGAIPENLLESELFGHKKGSFTSAHEDKPGLFQIADGGTVFLDEVGDLPPFMQVKLLHAIQYREILPVGSTEAMKVDIRLIAATSKDLSQEVQRGQFREDLYYRLNVISLDLPSLRSRKEDIPLLVNRILKRLNEELGKSVKGVDLSVLEAFMNYSWPGNIREMENVLEYAMTMSESETIPPHALPPRMRHGEGPPQDRVEHLAHNLEIWERRLIMEVLGRYQGDKRKSAAALGVDLATLYRKMRKHHIPTSMSP
jgi:two-component system, NtrC family, response regulator PilR